MVKKKKVCFISHNRNTQEYITDQLTTYLGQYLEVTGISLEEMKSEESIGDYDFYITSSNNVCEKIFNEKFCRLNVLLADRALSTENIDKVFELKRGTKALMVGNTYQTAVRGIELVKKIGIDYIELVPYYPDCNPDIAFGVDTAITTGSAHLIPKSVDKIIDLGVVGLDLSTYVELITKLQLPSELINNISQTYLREIYDLSLRRQIAAQDNYDIKKRFEVILNTVNEAIISVDDEGIIQLINDWAENLIGIDKSRYIGRPFNQLISSIEIRDLLGGNNHLENDIRRIKGVDYVVSSTAVVGNSNHLSGIIFSFKKVGEVQKIETKIRRELKDKNHVAKYEFQDIVGDSPEITYLTALAKRFSKTDFTVLIEGESGTGKELIAQAIHNSSMRSLGPFVAINLAALPENLVESELFGYEEGAFTGAKKTGKSGLFEEAHNGTIFLDEIGDASLDVQKKLLRVLEEKEVRRVGGSSIIPINVRVIAATNKNLFQLVQRQEFRSDLYYRLCAVSLSSPPLRDRGEDIVSLFNRFTDRNFRQGPSINLSDEVRNFFLSYDWPGNIRELENVANYICAMMLDGDRVLMEHLPMYLQRVFRDRALSPGIQNTSRARDGASLKAITEGLQKADQLEAAVGILQEIRIASMLDKGVGRNYLRSQLLRKGLSYKDYRLRKLLDNLSALGLIEQGVTKQGSKISKLGIEFLDCHMDIGQSMDQG